MRLYGSNLNFKYTYTVKIYNTTYSRVPCVYRPIIRKQNDVMFIEKSTQYTYVKYTKYNKILIIISSTAYDGFIIDPYLLHKTNFVIILYTDLKSAV